MTKSEYQAYENQVAKFIRDEQIDYYSSDDNERAFSHLFCECCNRPTAGTRVKLTAIWISSPTTVLSYSICEDCEYYLEYGQLDDMTMMDMERES